MKIKKLKDLDVNKPISILVYGDSGIGKTTFGIGAPKPIVIDLDRGLDRVDERFSGDRVEYMEVDVYEDILEFMQSDEIKKYESIVIDTFGKFIDVMFDYLARKTPKLRMYNGQPSQAGWGQIKTVATKFIQDLMKLNKNIIFIAHAKEEKRGEEIITRPDISGASGKELIKEIDLVGFMTNKGGNRTICFEPGDYFTAKNGLGLNGFIEVPQDNSLFSKILDKVQKKRENRKKLREEYDALLDEQDTKLSKVGTPEDLELLIKELKNQETKIIWGSRLIFWNKIKKLAKDKFNMEYDNANERFVACHA